MSLKEYFEKQNNSQLDKNFIHKYLVKCMKSEEFNKSVFVSVAHNGKNAIVEYKNANESTFKKSSYTKKYILNSNYALLTGFKSNVTVVDIDFTNVKKHGAYDDNEFYQKFRLDMLNNFNTYTVNTTNNGFHYYFEYDSEIQQTQNINNSNVDIRNDGGYIIIPPSAINGKSYGVVSNKKIIKMPYELKKWILEYQKKKLNNKIKKDSNKEIPEVQEHNDTAYKCNIDNKAMLDILNRLPKGNIKSKSFVGDYELWFNIGKGCKWCNCFDAFNEWSKNTPFNNYNEAELCRSWNSWNCNKNNFLYILKYAKVKDTFTYKGVSDNLIINKEINRGKIDRIESNKRFFKSKYNYVLKSGTGTGKTRAFLEYIKENPNKKFISIVSRVGLGDEQYNNLKSHNIKCELYTEQTFKYGDNIIITPESSVLINNYDFSNYTIFLDEFNSITEHLLSSSTLKTRRKNAFTTICKMIKNCQQFIAVDADISEISQEFLNLLRVEYKLVKNIYQNFKNKKCKFFNVESEFIEKLKGEKKFMLCCDIKNTAEVYHKLLGDDTIKLITSETTEKIDNLSNYDKVIFSPKIIYGLDSQNIRPVYAVFSGRTITPYQMVQQLTRERQLTQINIFFPTPTSKTALFDDNDKCENYQVTILNNFKDAYEINFDDIEDIEDIDNGDFEDVFNILHTKYIYKIDCLTTNPKLHLIDILTSRGFTVEFNPCIHPEITNEKINKAITEEIKAERLKDFDITNEKYAKLNEILKVPEEHLEAYKGLFIDPYELQRHFNYCSFFYQDISILYNKLIDGSDYDIKKVRSIKTKILFMDKLEKILNIPTRQPNQYIPNRNELKPEDKEYIEKNYKNLFERQKCKVTIYNDAYTIYTKAINSVCGNIGERKKKQINKERFKVLMLDSEEVEFHKKLYEFRH